MDIKKLLISDARGIEEMSVMATAILREHYDPIVGTVQNDYMLDKFQSVHAIKEQLEHGYDYYFVDEDGKHLGFIAMYPRDGAMYLSKFYLYKDARGKGLARKILAFVEDQAKEQGLSAIELNVNKRNGTISVYEKLGFERIRAEKNDIGSGYYMDDYVYRLEF